MNPLSSVASGETPCSVFPLEIYEHILELYTEDEIGWFLWYGGVRNRLSYICTAWRPKCRALVFRRVRLDGPKAMEKMRKLRRHLTTHPHLAPLVEEVDFYIHASEDLYQSTIEAFPSMLGCYLPRLRRIITVSERRSLFIHPHFSIRRIELHTVTVLELKAFIFNANFTLSWLIAPFPSLRVLDLDDVYWAVVPDLERIPPLHEVGLGLIPHQIHVAWKKENREAYERLLNESGPTMRTLTINLPVIHILTSCHKYRSDNFSLSALEVLNLEIYCSRSHLVTGEDWETLPYSQFMTDMVSFLLRLDAKNVRILKVSFDIEEIGSCGDDEFLDKIHNIRKGLEDVVISHHFPVLQAIDIDVGAGEAAVPIWQDRFESGFPLLAKRQLLHVSEHIRKRVLHHMVR